MNFNNPYNRADFLGFLREFLPDFIADEKRYKNFNFTTRYTIDATKLGTCQNMQLDVFEITHTSTHDARVGIAQDAFKLMLHKSYNNRALIIFKQENSSQYRFSLLQIEAAPVKNSSRITRSFSNPRRYSFLLGEGAHVKTPTEFLLKKGELTQKDGDYFNDLQERFSVEVLTKQFYKKLSDWYFWALKHVEFPSKPTAKKAHAENKPLEDLIKEHKATNVIRMLTRILFVWFIKQKGLIPEELFDEDKLKNDILTELNPIKQTGLFSETGKDSVYYKAILQNLFFASLNCPITPQSDDEDKRERSFRRDANYGDDFGNDWLFRHRKYFKNPEKFVELINSKVPFLNGGLFECLDDKHNKIYIDGFTDNLPKDERLIVPDYIFFGRDENVDLSDDYGEEIPQTKQASVKGLINILKTYNFTVEENTPAEVEVALDPELLGKVFENLLASFNPETKTTARKQTGSFYTPREIVNYMVDESLIAYFKGKTSIEEEQIRPLFQYTDEEHNLTETQVNELINALYHCKILDPACGSGAFPMGILQKLVHLLQKVDPENHYWEKVQKEKAQLEIQQALDTEDKKERENRLIEINNAFDISKNRPDYARKLFLIENCIYGVDIQPIATQISKLRFFISLVVDQNNDTDKDNNFGIIPLPNLETKFVTANTLIGINRPEAQLSLFDTEEIQKLQEELRVCRHKIFGAKTKKTKQKYRKLDKELRIKIADELKNNGWGSEDADNLAGWDPYDQNSSSPFFDPEWMFGLQRENGQLNSAEHQAGYFDVVIANPPYMDAELMVNLGLEDLRQYVIDSYKYISGNWDIYMAFFEKGLQLSKNILCYITPDKWLSKPFGLKFREHCMMPKLKKILHVGSGVFESATVDAIITVFVNNQEDTMVMSYNENKQIEFQNQASISNLKKPFLIDYLFSKNSNIVISIEVKNNKKIIDIAECENACATSDAYKLSKLLQNNNIFNPDTDFKLINTGTIGKYHHKWGVKEITYLGRKLLYPTVNKKDFSNTLGKSYARRAFSKKIIFKGLNLLDACIDLEGLVIPGKTTLVICSENNEELKLLLAIINSKLVFNYIKIKYASSSYCGGITFTKDMINNFPLPHDCKEYKNKIIGAIDDILDIKQINVDGDTSYLENQIDILVYKLYNLTYDEVKIIDPEIEKIISREEYDADIDSFK